MKLDLEFVYHVCNECGFADVGGDVTEQDEYFALAHGRRSVVSLPEPQIP